MTDCHSFIADVCYQLCCWCCCSEEGRVSNTAISNVRLSNETQQPIPQAELTIYPRTASSTPVEIVDIPDAVIPPITTKQSVMTPAVHHSLTRDEPVTLIRLK
jgi:hypothetical protein